MPRFAHPSQPIWVQPLWVTTRQMFYLALMIAMLAAYLITDSELAIAVDLETSADQSGLIQFQHDTSFEAASYSDAPNGYGMGSTDSNRTSNQGFNSRPTNWILAPT